MKYTKFTYPIMVHDLKLADIINLICDMQTSERSDFLLHALTRGKTHITMMTKNKSWASSSDHWKGGDA